MTKTIELTPAGPQDAALVASLHTRSWQYTYRGLLPDSYLASEAPAQRLRAWHARLVEGAEAPLEVTLARVDGEPAGFSCLLPASEPEFGIYLDNLHVMPEFHGVGLGKRLFAACARRVAAGWPGQPLFLYVLDGNAQAREFYRRLDGIESEPFDDLFPGTDLTVAVRRVTWKDVGALLARLGA
ncbi:N-acetyltransferase family protein [Cupriavidus sp. 2TAF22]|uniref:GNAT family N-acetyltransferase n=1 Tax=unclassified Cupriavidus TaxID=2640874 RepID=UPI003F9164E9